jgi:purine nucleoside permease
VLVEEAHMAGFRRLILGVLVLILIGLTATFFLMRRAEKENISGQVATTLAPKVLLVTMFQMGDPLDPNSPGEATIWVLQHQLTRIIPIPGAFSPLYCNEQRELCLVITGVGTTNAAMTMMALGLSEQLDLSKTYVMIAGIAGVSPEAATIESVAWGDWVVDTSVTGEYDSREMPASFAHPNFPYGCSAPGCEHPFKMGTEVYQVNPVLVEWGYRLTKDLKLDESELAKEKRALYPQQAAQQPPLVIKCAITGGNTFWHGKMMSDWATGWVKDSTDGQGHYCMTAVEDPAILAAVNNLGKSGRYDPKRVMAIRVGSNFDQQHPGQTAEESLRLALAEVNQAVGMNNLHLVGWTVLEQILGDWAKWKAGVPALP